MVAQDEINHLLGKLGEPLPVQAGKNQNGSYRLVEVKHSSGKYSRVLVESNCGEEQIARAVAAALAEIARGRR